MDRRNTTCGTRIRQAVAASCTPGRPVRAAVLGAMLVASPALGAAALADPVPTATVSAPGSAAGRQVMAATEGHIADLHARLHITPAEEPAWNDFAGVMRQNAVELTAKLDQRQQTVATMSAVQDLTSYADITELHAQQITKLVAPFQALYAEFDPQQKQTADRIFHAYAQKTGRSR